MNLRDLRETGLLLVHRLRDENAGFVLRKGQPKRTSAPQKRQKRFVADPGGIEENIITKPPDFAEHIARVVEAAVICAKLNRRQSNGPSRLRLLGANFRNLSADEIFFQASRGNATDGAVGIAHCFQIHRRRPRQEQRPLRHRFVIVPIKKHEVSRREQRPRDDFVRRRCPIQHEIRLVRAEDACRILLRQKRRTFMNEQVPQRDIRIAQIRPKQILTEKFIKCASRRMPPMKRAALMPGTIKLRVSSLRIRTKFTKKRRQESGLIRRRFLLDPPRDIRLSVTDRNDRNPKSRHRLRHRRIGRGDDDRRYIGKIRLAGGNDVSFANIFEKFSGIRRDGDFKWFHGNVLSACLAFCVRRKKLAVSSWQ